jgi:hypothetical protein
MAWRESSGDGARARRSFGPACFYVLEGGFDFRGGSDRAGDWVWEAAGAISRRSSGDNDLEPIPIRTGEILAASVCERRALENGRGKGVHFRSRVLRIAEEGTPLRHISLSGLQRIQNAYGCQIRRQRQPQKSINLRRTLDFIGAPVGI